MLAERKVYPMAGRVERIQTVVSSNASAYQQSRPYHFTMDGFAIGVIGTPLILHGKYDPLQSWLPFMSGAIMLNPPPEVSDRYGLDAFHLYNSDRLLTDRLSGRYGEKQSHREKWESDWEHDLIAPNEHDRAMFFWPGDWAYDQHLLPFAETQHVESGSEYRQVHHLWDRLGEPVLSESEDEDEDDPEDTRPMLDVEIQGLSRASVLLWLRENCTGRFYLPSDARMAVAVKVTFERAADWMFAKLRFDGQDRFEELERPAP